MVSASEGIRAPEAVHVHVFSQAVDRPPGQVIESIRKVAHQNVRFIGQFIGSFQVYAHIQVDSLASAQRLASDVLWGEGLRSESSTEVRESRIMAPKRASPDFCALIRIRPDIDPFSMLDRLDDHFERLVDPETYWYGAAVVTGRGYDLLVDLGRPSFEELFEAVVRDLRAVDGIGRTDTSWADLSVNSFRNY
jgi:hypothetical protein